MGDIDKKVNALTGKLEDQLQDITTRVEKLELLSKKLIPDNELSQFLKEYKEVKNKPKETGENGIDDTELDSAMIRYLEKQRIDLVMDIQGQDYIRDKLMELIGHNSDMVSSVKEYLENKPQMIKDDYTMINERINHYVQDFVKPTVGNLKVNNLEMKRQVSYIETIIHDLNKKLQENHLIMLSSDYETKINECIKRLNELFTEVSKK